MDKEFMPTMSGNTLAYDAEWFDGDHWVSIPVQQNDNKNGIPYPRRLGGIIGTIGLMGFEQAHAIAWMFAASAESKGESIKVRVAKYEFIYDLKARRIQGIDLNK